MDNLTDSSWIWEDTINTTLDNNNNICESVTNHWLYFIFSGYLLPLISPKVREYLMHIYSTLKNSKVTGDIVSLTEFGFEKIQDIEDNKEMKNYIKRLCDKKNPNWSNILKDETIEKFAWEFSGQKKGDNPGIQQTWKKLNKMLDNGVINMGRP